MAKELSVLQQQAEAIKTEVNKGANTSNRIGGMFSDILEYNEGKFTELEYNIRDLLKAVSLYTADYNHYFDIGEEKKLYIKTSDSSNWGCFIIPINKRDVFCLGISPGNVNGIVGLTEMPQEQSTNSTDIKNIIDNDLDYCIEQINENYFITIINPNNSQYIGFTFNKKTDNKKAFCVKVGGAFLTQYDMKNINYKVSSIIQTLNIYYPNPTTYFDSSNDLYCSPTNGNYSFESIIAPIKAGDIILTGVGTMTNYKFLSEKPTDILPQSGCHDISDLVVDVEKSLIKNNLFNYAIYKVPEDIGNAKYIGITLASNLPSINKYLVVSPSYSVLMTDYDRTLQYMNNLRSVSDSIKNGTRIEWLPVYFDLGSSHPNGYVGKGANNKCIIVPAVKGDVVKIPLTSGLINPCTLSSFPEIFGDLEDGILLNKNIEKKVIDYYTEYTITDNNAKYFSVTVNSSTESPELPIIIDSGNVTLKELNNIKSDLKEVKESIPFINNDLGLIKDFNFGKYDDICLIMDGQSLSIGWESIAISTAPQDNCYMIGTDPCTLYRNTGFNGIGINPLKSVTRESPNVSWCNVMSKLIPNKRFITSSVGEGDKTIAQLSKTDNTEVIEAEFCVYGAIDASNGSITLSTDYISFILDVNPGETYYISGISQYITEYSEKPKWQPIDNSFNNSIYLGNGGGVTTGKQYIVPDGVHYIGLCQKNADYVTKKAFIIKGTANRYEKGFILPMYQLKAVEDNSNRNIGCPAIVWMQGEGDVSANKTKEYYKEMLIKLKNDMQSDVMKIFGQSEKPLFFCYMLALTGQKENNIMMAIAECCQENNDMILIAPIYAMPDYNNLHLSSNGNRWYGEYIARSTYNALVLGKRDNCITPYQFLIDNTKLKIKVNAPKLPLVIDTWTVQEVPQAGFRIWKDGLEITISNITLYGDEITLNCDTDISNGVIEVSYAGYNPSDSTHYRGTGNIRDSDRWQALQTYWDDTDDTGTNATSAITYRPKTIEGESLIGKLYPMQNWLQNFYYKLS